MARMVSARFVVEMVLKLLHLVISKLSGLFLQFDPVLMCQYLESSRVDVAVFVSVLFCFVPLVIICT